MSDLNNVEIHGISVVIAWHALVSLYKLVKGEGGIKNIALAFWRGDAKNEQKETKG